MKTIQFNDKKYDIPQSWDEVTLEQQIKVTADAEHFTTDTTKRIAILSGYMGISPEELRHAHIQKVAPLFKHLKFIGEAVPDKPVAEFEFNGSTYYVAQNLVEQEFQDFVSLENALQGTKGDLLRALPLVIAILAKKRTEDGFETIDDYDVEKRAEEFKRLPIAIANGIGVFFYTSVNTFTAISPSFSQPNNLVEMKANSLLNTLKPQAGQGLLMRWLLGVSRSYIKFIKKNASKYFTSTPRKSLTQRWRIRCKRLLLRKRKDRTFI